MATPTYRRRFGGRHSAAAVLLSGSLIVAACGGSSENGLSQFRDAPTTTAATDPTPAPSPDPTTPPAPSPPTTEEPAPDTTVPAAPAGLAASLEDAEAAVVQITTDGTFRDPFEGELFFAGTGTGFVIDPSGLVITNHHVVSGAGAVRARFGADGVEVPARILGVSECNDLAVLQLIDEGPYPYLGWFEGDIRVGTEVYAAGYPLGDPRYTLTRGVVSKSDADGQSSWSSVRQVIEHDANIQPGNSGGPLLTADGAVLGINYAALVPGTGTSQYFAIPMSLAERLSTQLLDGDQETIGVNGQSIWVDQSGTVPGVWVSGVTPGGPASNAGIRAGDVIIELNGVGMTLGTMQAYCDVLRTATPGAAMSAVVYRPDTDEVLTGELNGRELAPVAGAAPDQVVDNDDIVPESPGTSTDGFVEIGDDSGRIFLDVPVEWSDIDTSFSEFGPQLIASPNIDAFLGDNDPPPGVLVLAFDGIPQTDFDEVLDLFDLEFDFFDCLTRERLPYEDGLYSGAQFLRTGCGPSSSNLRLIAAGLPGADYVFIVVLLYPPAREDIPIVLTQSIFVFD